jgi:acyl-CoA synthetase (NDP forming)
MALTMGDSLVSMLEARSVAVVGASPRAGSFGQQMMVQLLQGGFDGAVHPVNPRHREVFGLPCVATLDGVPGTVDVAILGIPNAAVEEQLTAAAGLGIPSAVIFASCYEDPQAGRPSLPERLAAIAAEAGMAVCGGNGMGFLNVERHLRACGFSQPLDLEPGGITFVTHSGSAFSAMLHNDRRLQFNLVVSAGLEFATTLDQYVDYALSLDSTKAIALFMEAVRRPGDFLRVLAAAADRDIPVVALKVGSAPAAQEMVVAHSGALAGEAGAFEAVFDAHGVLAVRSLDEMADTLELLVAGRRAGPGGLASIHDSGGERAHLIDAAESVGVRFASISDTTRRRLADVLEPGLPAVNPLDAWGTGNDADRIFEASMGILLDDEDTAALAFAVDLTTEDESGTGYPKVARSVFDRTHKPFAVLSNLSSAVDRHSASDLRAHGVPVLEGTPTGLAAFKHLFELRDHRRRAAVPLARGSAPDLRSRWEARLATGTPISESEGMALLRDYGIPTVAAEAASNADEAVAAAERIGWPVALKTSATDIPHKSAAGGVVSGIESEPALRSAHEEMAARLGPNVTVEEMAPPGVELALGVVRDEQFGPLVMLAAGGVLIEALRDRAFALPPLDQAGAGRMLNRLAIRRLVPDQATGSVCDAVVRLSVLASELGDSIRALDVNPLIATSDACRAVDVLIVT